MKRLIQAATTALFLGAFALPQAGAQEPSREEFKARREAMCAENPERCEKMKARHAEMKAKCEANPEECALRKEARRERMQKMKAKCDANPEECAQRKEQWKQKREAAGQ